MKNMSTMMRMKKVVIESDYNAFYELLNKLKQFMPFAIV